MGNYMTYYDSDAAPPRALPGELLRKLVEARAWRDRRLELEKTIARSGGLAERNQADRDEVDLQAAEILEEIVEVAEVAGSLTILAQRSGE